MGKIIGILLTIVVFMVTFYSGLWVCFVGGIVQVIDSAKATPVHSMGIAIGVLRVVLTGTVIQLGIFLTGLCGMIT